MGFANISQDKARRIATLRAAYEAALSQPAATAIASRSRLLLAHILVLLEGAERDRGLCRPGC